MAKCLVIGGCGFVGSNLVERLVKDGHEVIVFDNLFLGSKENLDRVKEKIEFHQVSISEAEKYGLLINKKFDFVFLMGNYSSAPMFYTDTRNRVSETIIDFLHALELSKMNNAKFIYASSSSLQGPLTYYSGVRDTYETLAEMYFIEEKLNSVGMRFFSIYGGDKYNERHKKNYANMVTQMYWYINGDSVPGFTWNHIYGDGNQTRDFVHILDIVESISKSMDYKKPGAHIFEVGRGVANSFNEVFEIINKVLGKNVKPEYVGNPIKNYVIHTLSNEYKKTMDELNWSPKIELEEGIKLMIDWFVFTPFFYFS